MENITNNAETYVNNENEINEYLNKPITDLQPIKTKEQKAERIAKEKADRLAKIESDKLLQRISLLTSFIEDLKENKLTSHATNLEKLHKFDFESAIVRACDLIEIDNETNFNRVVWQNWILRVIVTKSVDSLEKTISKSNNGHFDLMNDFHPLQRRDLRITFKGHELLTTVLNCFDKRKKCQITDEIYNSLPKCITEKQLQKYFVRIESK